MNKKYKKIEVSFINIFTIVNILISIKIVINIKVIRKIYNYEPNIIN